MEHEEQDFPYLCLYLVDLHGIERSANGHISAPAGVVRTRLKRGSSLSPVISSVGSAFQLMKIYRLLVWVK